MISVDGNTTALIQVKDEGTKNIIGEKEHVWIDHITERLVGLIQWSKWH